VLSDAIIRYLSAMAMVQFAVAKARLVNALLQPKVGEEALTMPVIDEFFDGLHRAVSHNAYIAITVYSA